MSRLPDTVHCSTRVCVKVLVALKTNGTVGIVQELGSTGRLQRWSTTAHRAAKLHSYKKPVAADKIQNKNLAATNTFKRTRSTTRTTVSPASS